MPTHISLPNERVEQLRLIAKAKNKTIVEIIADYVRSEIAAGTIPGTVPGIDVRKTGPEITITGRDFSVSLPAEEGPTLADLLKQSGSATADPERKERWIASLATLSGVKVKRAGNGVKLVSPITGREFPLNLDIAADLADEISRTAE